MTLRLRWIRAAAYLGLGLGIAIGTSTAIARQGLVRTKDGRNLEGDIDDKGEQVVIVIRGIQTKVPRDNVTTVEYFDDVAARYKDKLDKLPKKPSVKDRLDLAHWLFELKSYDNALREVDAAKIIDPNSAEAAAFEQTIMSQRRMESSRPATGTGATGTGATGTGTKLPATGDKLPERRYITADDINNIRQIEWKEKDATTPRVTVPADVRKKYTDMKAVKPADFQALTPAQQAYVILRDPDTKPDMRHSIRLTTDPASLNEFRTKIQPLVVNNCATTGCHGGHNAGKFFLYNTNTDREDVAYTNYYILTAYKQDFGDKSYEMIDRTYPDHSILAEFALHPDAAELDHPPLKGQAYKPIALNKSSPSYLTISNWMKSLITGEPKYGITYELPIGDPKAVKTVPKEKDAPKTPAGGAAAPAGGGATAAPGGPAPLVPGTVPPVKPPTTPPTTPK